MQKGKEMTFLQAVGYSCSRYRRYKNPYFIKTIAKETGYSISNIYNFENGKISNMFIFSWYVSKGFDIHRDVVLSKDPLELGSLGDLARRYMHEAK